MPGQEYDSRSWTTEAQWTWLWSKRSGFLSAQKVGRLSTFMASVYQDWFVEWPEIAVLFEHEDASRLTEEEKEKLGKAVADRRTKLSTWFRNRCRTRPSNANITSLMAAAGVTKRATRLPQKIELYSKKYYQARVKPTVTAQLSELKDQLGRSLTSKEKLDTIKKCTQSAFASESQEVRDDVDALYAQAKGTALASDAALAEGNASGARTPSQFQVAIDYAPQVLENVLNPLAKSMGWTFSIFGAGPVPEEGGQISSMAAHFGRNQHGHTFPQATPDFEEQFIRPFGKFAKSVFPRTVREQRRLTSTDQVGGPSSEGSLSHLDPLADPIPMNLISPPVPETTTPIAPTNNMEDLNVQDAARGSLAALAMPHVLHDPLAIEVQGQELIPLLQDFSGPLFRFPEQSLSGAFMTGDFSGIDVNELFMPPIPDLTNASIPSGGEVGTEATTPPPPALAISPPPAFAISLPQPAPGAPAPLSTTLLTNSPPPTPSITLPAEPVPETAGPSMPSAGSVPDVPAVTPPVASGCEAPALTILSPSRTVLDDITASATNGPIASDALDTPDIPDLDIATRRTRRDRRAPRPADAGWVEPPSAKTRGRPRKKAIATSTGETLDDRGPNSSRKRVRLTA